MKEQINNVKKEEKVIITMLSDTRKMIGILDNLNKNISSVVFNDSSVISNINRIFGGCDRIKANSIYNSSFNYIYTKSLFYTNLDNFYQNNIFLKPNVDLKNFKVEQIVDLGNTLEALLDSYNNLDDDYTKKTFVDMIKDMNNVCERLIRFFKIIKPYLKNGITIKESIDLIKKEDVKNAAIKYCQLTNEVLYKSLGSYHKITPNVFDTCDTIASSDINRVSYNDLNMWKEQLSLDEINLNNRKSEINDYKQSLIRKCIFEDLKKVHSLSYELENIDIKTVNANDIRNYKNRTQELLNYFKLEYNGVNEDYFTSSDYNFVLNNLDNIVNNLNKILDFPLMNYVFSTKILKYYRHTNLSKQEKNGIRNDLRTLTSLGKNLSSNIYIGLEKYGEIKKVQKRSLWDKIFKKDLYHTIEVNENLGNGKHRVITRKERVLDEKIKNCYYNNWEYNKKLKKDESVCSCCNDKKVREHIHNYSEIGRDTIDLENGYQKNIKIKQCLDCEEKILIEEIKKVEKNMSLYVNTYSLFDEKREVLEEAKHDLENIKEMSMVDEVNEALSHIKLKK